MSGGLYHFSEEGTIENFVPRPVRTPSPRPPGREWLNGPLVWAIDDWHQPLYLFPRDCPRILIWRLPSSTEADASRYFGGSPSRMVAYLESDWRDRLDATSLYRYTLPAETFEPLDDAGMWVSRSAVRPVECTRIESLPDALAIADVTLHTVPDLQSLSDVWQTSLHASGIRLRNARGGWPRGRR